MKQRNVIITVGDDEDFTPIIRCVPPILHHTPHTPSYSPYSIILPIFHLFYVRVWNYEKITKEGTPTLARTIPAVIPNSKQSAAVRSDICGVHWWQWWYCDIPQVMVVCAHENMMLMAVGFKDGTVVTIRGNLTRDRLSTMKVVHSEDSPGVYVTGTCRSGAQLPAVTSPSPSGLAFRQIGNTTILMISTSNGVYANDITHKKEVSSTLLPFPLSLLPFFPSLLFLPPFSPPSLPLSLCR